MSETMISDSGRAKDLQLRPVPLVKDFPMVQNLTSKLGLHRTGRYTLLRLA